MRSASSSPTRLLWAAALLAALGSAVTVQASPSFSDNTAAAGSNDMAAMVGVRGSSRLSSNLDSQIDLTKRATGDSAHPDLAAAPMLGSRAVANLQTFQGALANIQAPPITQSNDATRPFEVDGDTFTDFQTAVGRSCDNQHNSCADAANSQKSSSFTVGDCDQQNTRCKSSGLSATQSAFIELASSSPEFDIFCDI